MPMKNGRKNTVKPELRDERATGLWVDSALILRLHGRKSSTLAIAPTHTTEASRLLHYADVILGTDKKEKFVSAKPTKERKDL